MSPFTGPVTCAIWPGGTLWVRWHLAANANERITAAEAFDVLGPWRMMAAMAKAPDVLFRERVAALERAAWTILYGLFMWSP